MWLELTAAEHAAAQVEPRRGLGLGLGFPRVNGRIIMSGSTCSTIVVGTRGLGRITEARAGFMCGEITATRAGFMCGEIAKPQKAVALSGGGSIGLLPDRAERHESGYTAVLRSVSLVRLSRVTRRAVVEVLGQGARSRP